MLYVKLFVNGHPVSAFVDSGAQATILSPQCAQVCGLTDRIDARWAGVARGVGTAKVLGRIMKAPVRFNFRIQGERDVSEDVWDEVQCSFTVMEGRDVDMLLGLDMLKRHRACVDLKEHVLRFGDGQEVPFLGEGALPKRAFGGDEPDVPAGEAEGSTSAAAPGPGNFAGTGHTLGAGSSGSAAQPIPSRPSNPTPATASSTNPTRPGASTSTTNTAATPAAASAPTPSSQSADVAARVDQVVQITGCGREEAVSALREAGGNLDAAVGILLDFV